MKNYKQLKADIILNFYLDEICKFQKVKKSEVLEKSRKREFEDIRHIAIFLAKKQVPKMKLKDISDFFNLKEHSTITHCLKKIENLKTLDWDIIRTLEHCRKLDFVSAILESNGFSAIDKYWLEFEKENNNVTLRISMLSDMSFVAAIKYGQDDFFYIEDLEIFDAIIIAKNINSNPLGILINSLKNQTNYEKR